MVATDTAGKKKPEESGGGGGRAEGGGGDGLAERETTDMPESAAKIVETLGLSELAIDDRRGRDRGREPGAAPLKREVQFPP